jgi:hypothetical protein
MRCLSGSWNHRQSCWIACLLDCLWWNILVLIQHFSLEVCHKFIAVDEGECILIEWSRDITCVFRAWFYIPEKIEIFDVCAPALPVSNVSCACALLTCADFVFHVLEWIVLFVFYTLCFIDEFSGGSAGGCYAPNIDFHLASQTKCSPLQAQATNLLYDKGTFIILSIRFVHQWICLVRLRILAYEKYCSRHC